MLRVLMTTRRESCEGRVGGGREERGLETIECKIVIFYDNMNII